MFSAKHMFDLFGFYEEGRFVRLPVGIGLTRYVCVHLEPENIHADPPAARNETRAAVELVRVIAADTGCKVRGRAGQCKTCGKVYYWEEP